ncbi:MAG: hypothetical protein CMM24_00080 [Rhodospirillaceae bacterium]|nr:hypothetical protein [Rhodospirillaceae bacterium]
MIGHLFTPILVLKFVFFDNTIILKIANLQIQKDSVMSVVLHPDDEIRYATLGTGAPILFYYRRAPVQTELKI